MAKKLVAKKNVPPGAETASLSSEAAGSGNLQVIITGDEAAVRRALTAMRFEGVWGKTMARTIALDATLVADPDLDDKLGGKKVALFSQDARDLYRQRCVNEAGRLGHPVANPGKIPAGKDTTVMEVGDALFKHARP